MSLSKKKRTKEEEQIIKRKYIKVIQEHVKMMEELFSEDLIETIPENGIGGHEVFHEGKLFIVLSKLFFLNMVVSRMLGVDLKELVDNYYDDEEMLSAVDYYLTVLGIGVADETKEGGIRYGL